MSLPGFTAETVFPKDATGRFGSVSRWTSGRAPGCYDTVKLALWGEDDGGDDWGDGSGDGFQGFGDADGQDGGDGAGDVGDVGLGTSQQCLLDCIRTCPTVLNRWDPAGLCIYMCIDRCTSVLV